MSETAEVAAATKRSYTRRTTRDRVVDLLEQAIELVKARCVDPAKNAAVAAAKLAASKREFAEAVEQKKNENLVSPLGATAFPTIETAPLAATAFPTVTAAPATKATKTKKEAKTKTVAPLTAVATAAAPFVAPVVNSTRKTKKAASCPGGPKAFNEFLKSKRAEVEAELGGKAPYSQVRARIAELWKESCPKPPTKTRKVATKVATKVTPGRVNAVVPGALSPLAEVSESKEAEETLTEPDLEAEAEEEAEDAAANLGYEDLGIDDMRDMRKIRVDGRDLYMVDANSSIFDRNDEDDDPLGEFVGYLRDGKIVEQNAPNS